MIPAPPPAATRSDPLAAFASLRRGDPAPPWLLAAICEGWGWDPARTATALIAVSENATFRVDRDGAPRAVVRVHRPGYVDPNQIASELNWVRALAIDTEVSVAEVLPTADGALVHAANGPDAESGAKPWHVVAFAHVSGAVLEEVADPAQHYRRIGEITAAFHEQAEFWPRPSGFDRFGWNIGDMLGEGARWGDWRNAALTSEQGQLMELAETRAIGELVPLIASGEGRGLIHADLRPSNIMISGDELTVIDFDDCGIGWYLYDFASALSFIEHEDRAPAIAREWVEGYASVRPLSREQLGYACVFSMIRRLQLLGWATTHREDALPAHISAQMVSGTERVAANYLTSATWLFEDIRY